MSWQEAEPGTLPEGLREVSAILGRNFRQTSRLFGGLVGKCWPVQDGKRVNPKLLKIATKQSFKSCQARKSALKRHHANAERTQSERTAISEESLDPKESLEKTKPKTLLQGIEKNPQSPAPKRAAVQSVTEHQNQPKKLAADQSVTESQSTEWPEELREIRQALEDLDVLPWFDDPKYWQRIETWLKDTTVFFLDELKAYVAWITVQAKTRQNRNHMRGLRNWLQNAKTREESRATRKEVWKR